VNSITQQLRKNNPAVIQTLSKLANHLTGFVPDWNVDVDNDRSKVKHSPKALLLAIVIGRLEKN
jgi:hypothetical protein